MDVSGLDDDLYELYRTRSSYWVPHIPAFQNPCSNIKWKFGPIFRERESYGGDDIYKTWMEEVSATCVATQLEGPNPGIQGIAKIRMQYVDN